ncbi:hypothetical protein [Burkholderia gladioli]|uniref:hypothetical protein n=1 Tax=Burkholderia gladioli TaxID=28095 RepID=UPI0016411611|nr:hypothetical protein [Burkholderia gladioli]
MNSIRVTGPKNSAGDYLNFTAEIDGVLHSGKISRTAIAVLRNGENGAPEIVGDDIEVFEARHERIAFAVRRKTASLKKGDIIELCSDDF